MKITTKVFSGFAVILFFTLTGFLIQYKLSQEVNRNMGYVSNSEEIIRTSTALHKTIIEMQASVRGFLLTDNEVFLEPYYLGSKVVPEMFKAQRALLPESSVQRRRLDSISILQHDWENYSRNLLEAKKESQISEFGRQKYRKAFNERLMKGEGIRRIAVIKNMFNEFDKTEYNNRNQRREVLKKSIRIANAVSVGLIILDIIIAIGIGFLILKTISGRISKMVFWAEEIAKGKFIVINDQNHDELKRLSDSLNTMSRQLDSSFSELREKNKELDQFAYATSHDLKAPLRGMYNILQWIEEDIGGNVPPELSVYHDKLKGRIIRLERVINGLLEYARIGRDKTSKEEVKVSELLASVTDMIVPPHFRLEIRNEVDKIWTEKVLLEQVFSNLISNAVKFQNKPGQEMIRITGKELNNHYQFTVEDNGIGINNEYHEKIYAMFQTLREKHESENTGIGLAIVKKIIEEKNGEIRLESVPGEGSVFTILWPKY